MRTLKFVIVFVLASVIASCSGGCASTNQSISAAKYDINQKVLNPYLSSVAIQNQDSTIVGSGTIVLNERGKHMVVITAAHVVKYMEDQGFKIFVKTTYDALPREMFTKKIDNGLDLAILTCLRVEKKDGPFVKVRERGAKVGDIVWAIGCPRGEFIVVTMGNLSKKFVGVEVDGLTVTIRRMYRFTAPIFSGNSGGGLFNERGELIGVNVEMGMVPGKVYIIQDGVARRANLITFFTEPGAYYAVGAQEIADFFNK